MRVTALPPEHIVDAHKLTADGAVDLFELTPVTGGIVRFKADNDVTWRGNLYTGLPLALTGVKLSADSAGATPKLIIGQPNLNLSMFKPLVYDGGLDGAFIRRHRILLDHLISNQDIKQSFSYVVRRVEGYSRSQITLQLTSASDTMSFTLPFVQYLPPAFPAVAI